MNKIYASLILLGIGSTCLAQDINKVIKQEEVTGLIRALSADEMQGRGTFTPGIDKAATFIESEFKKIGLQPLNGEKGFRQEFTVTRVLPGINSIVINGKNIDPDNTLILSDKASVQLSNTSGLQVVNIVAGQEFIPRYREVLAMKSSALVLVDPSHASIFKRLQDNFNQGRIIENPGTTDVVFVLGESSASTFTANATNKVETLPLFNVAGMIPGKSKEKELVLFSAHYDHLGITKSVQGDSIANGADDDASGTTAVISLAKYYKSLNNNARTLVFVAFTAEELGGFGSKYFSSKLNADEVIAMFNIEMIGKESKFGKNAAFITGYERSDFGEILQKNLKGTDFKFHPDPYPDQNLFYRSDNARLAALGVPAHTISTDQIDSDKFYHTVNDEFETLDPANILATIKAIALSARSIVAGTDTPSRIPKLEE